MTAKTYLVTGANRGLGIEFVKQVIYISCCKLSCHDSKSVCESAND